jgi:trans-2-enoyl-CoA reductase
MSGPGPTGRKKMYAEGTVGPAEPPADRELTAVVSSALKAGAVDAAVTVAKALVDGNAV